MTPQLGKNHRNGRYVNRDFILLHRKHIHDIIITPAPTGSNGPIGWLQHQQNLYGVWSLTNIKIWRAPNKNHVTSHLPCSVSSHVQTIQWSNEVKFTRLKMLTNSKNDDLLLVNPFASHILIINPWPWECKIFSTLSGLTVVYDVNDIINIAKKFNQNIL